MAAAAAAEAEAEAGEAAGECEAAAVAAEAAGEVPGAEGAQPVKEGEGDRGHSDPSAERAGMKRAGPERAHRFSLLVFSRTKLLRRVLLCSVYLYKQ